MEWSGKGAGLARAGRDVKGFRWEGIKHSLRVEVVVLLLL